MDILVSEIAALALELGRVRIERDTALRQLHALRAELDELQEALGRMAREKDADERDANTDDEEPTP